MNFDRKRIENLKQKQSDYKKVFNSEEGKRVLKDLQSIGFFSRSTINENSNKMAYNEGMRAILLHIETMRNYDFENLKKHMEENDG
jgi:hypothetical protein